MTFTITIPIQIRRAFDGSDEGPADYSSSDDELTIHVENVKSKWDAIWALQESLEKLVSK